ncbi:hypothetical protein J2Z84_004290 [Agrobacterium rubi]|nr:hypothetical protein [Agrobacterium rubi]
MWYAAWNAYTKTMGLNKTHAMQERRQEKF